MSATWSGSLISSLTSSRRRDQVSAASKSLSPKATAPRAPHAYERRSTSPERSANSLASRAAAGVFRSQKLCAMSAFARETLSASVSSSARSIQPATSSRSGRFAHIDERIAVWNASSL